MNLYSLVLVLAWSLFATGCSDKSVEQSPAEHLQSFSEAAASEMRANPDFVNFAIEIVACNVTKTNSTARPFTARVVLKITDKDYQAKHNAAEVPDVYLAEDGSFRGMYDENGNHYPYIDYEDPEIQKYADPKVEKHYRYVHSLGKEKEYGVAFDYVYEDEWKVLICADGYFELDEQGGLPYNEEPPSTPSEILNDLSRAFKP